MNQYQDDDWQQEEQRRREAYYRMNSQNSNTPDALEQIFRGPLNWMNLLMIGINIVVFVIMEILGSTEDTGFMLQWGAACRPLILDGEWYRLFTSMFLHFGIYQKNAEGEDVALNPYPLLKNLTNKILKYF